MYAQEFKSMQRYVKKIDICKSIQNIQKKFQNFFEFFLCFLFKSILKHSKALNGLPKCRLKYVKDASKYKYVCKSILSHSI